MQLIEDRFLLLLLFRVVVVVVRSHIFTLNTIRALKIDENATLKSSSGLAGWLAEWWWWWRRQALTLDLPLYLSVCLFNIPLVQPRSLCGAHKLL